jgi:hypothetical protein
MEIVMTRPSSNYLVTVKYDEQGKEFIKGLRKYYRENWGLSLSLRGRGHRFGHGKHTKKNGGDNCYQASIPLARSSHVAIYLR